MPKCKEQEALFLGDVDNFRGEIVVKGQFLLEEIVLDYPDAERVSEAIRDVLRVVLSYDLEGKWVTSCVSGAEYVTTREIRSVSIYFLICFKCNVLFFSNRRLFSDYSAGRC
jgi:hypothetical protein